MTQTLLTHAQMIENIVGEFSPTEHPELYKAGFNFVADIIPTTSELWQNDNVRGISVPNGGRLVRGGNSDEAMKSYKVLSAWRKSSGVWYQCKEVSWSKFREGLNTDSLYYHGNAHKNPIYTISDGGRLFISPASSANPSEGFTGEPSNEYYSYIKYWQYEVNDYHDDESYMVQAMHGYPKEAQLLAIIKSAMNIMQIKISEAVHEDEDAELLQLQQAQMQQLQQWFEMEANRLNLPWRNVGIEEDK
tara:strand:- start:326 stop:1066 length:741 start_codon:yes stop_codon:yes gene_type:complete